MKDEVISIKGSVTSSIHKCTSLHSDLLQLLEIVQKIGDNKELCLIASIKCKHIIQQALTLLGKSGKVFKVQGKSEYNVRIPSDSFTCGISGICALPDGQVLVTDYSSKRVKLLSQQYQVVSHWDVNAYPHAICLITPSEVAVAVNKSNMYEVQFITVNQGKLVPGRKFQLQHKCRGIARHQGDLFVTSGKELYKYSLSGKLICRLYQDRSADYTVDKCAVSPTGDRLYIIIWQHKLLTLARDGTLLATYTGPALDGPCGLHVTPAGQVLVCGYWSHTVLQVGWEGKSKLATLGTRRKGCVHWLLSQDKDAEDVMDKDDLNTQKQDSLQSVTELYKPMQCAHRLILQCAHRLIQLLLSKEYNCLVKGSTVSKSSDVGLTLTREKTEDLHLQVGTATTEVGPAGAPLLPFDLWHQREKITGMFEDFPPGILLDGLNLRDSVQTKGKSSMVHPWGMPQVNPSECVTNHFKTKQPHIDSTIKKALKNDSSFDVSSSLLFDSQPNLQIKL
ncbi:hypothetical protein DPMN_003335 [Dreissena polymorpha]|uniref:Uncharacterized protein n=1 Tax=Dreissena polymorpha TaxID=45954 RepID=A0A9D4MQG1_DREPO|nr:hypothetical protein DPMN_003335 [Dreissena polymorpha]